MKHLFIILSILLLMLNIACAETVSPYKAMEASYKKQFNNCRAVAKNFHADNQFSGYLKNRCMLYDLDRQRILNLLFPMTSKNGSEYKETYKQQMALYAIEMDNKQIEATKQIVIQYCRNNQYKFKKSDPTVCLRASKLF